MPLNHGQKAWPDAPLMQDPDARSVLKHRAVTHVLYAALACELLHFT